MGYESPIEIIMGQMRMEIDNQIFKAVQNAGINVDRGELLRALEYDRRQYQKGYRDRDDEIVRCKDCWKRNTIHCPVRNTVTNVDEQYADNWFCKGGERKG